MSRNCSVAGRWAVLVLLATLASGPWTAFAATDCGRAKKSNIDMLMCSNDRLARADNFMALAFRDAFRRADDPEALIADQARWREEVRDACMDVPCLLRAYEDRTSELTTWGAGQ